jgi:hypothetical protein
MDAILISANPKIARVEDAVEHLANHAELYWEVGFGIVADNFSYPMYAFIHVCGKQVEYRASIREIVPFSRDHYEGTALAERVKPKRWRDEWKENINKCREHPWKYALVMTEITRVSYDTCSFEKKKDGTNVRRPPENFVSVLPPGQAPANRAQSGSSLLAATKSGRSQPDRSQRD